ncbi:MAG: hypothetical protein IKX81_01485, partial [Firmicutes bacterium]|nr:hypothetical protein [Bacillota bacterium]
MDNFDNREPENQPEERETRRESQAPRVEQPRYYTYNQQQYDQQQYGQQQTRQQYSQPQYGAPQYASVPQQGGVPTWLKVLLIIALIIALIGFMFTSCIKNLTGNMNGLVDDALLAQTEGTSIDDITGEYIAVLHIETQISQSSS